MSANESDEDPLLLEINFYYKPEYIAFNIEYDPVSFYYNCAGIGLPDFVGRFPGKIQAAATL